MSNTSTSLSYPPDLSTSLSHPIGAPMGRIHQSSGSSEQKLWGHFCSSTPIPGHSPFWNGSMNHIWSIWQSPMVWDNSLNVRWTSKQTLPASLIGSICTFQSWYCKSPWSDSCHAYMRCCICKWRGGLDSETRGSAVSEARFYWQSKTWIYIILITPYSKWLKIAFSWKRVQIYGRHGQGTPKSKASRFWRGTTHFWTDEDALAEDDAKRSEIFS